MAAFHCCHNRCSGRPLSALLRLARLRDCRWNHHSSGAWSPPTALRQCSALSIVLQTTLSFHSLVHRFVIGIFTSQGTPPSSFFSTLGHLAWRAGIPRCLNTEICLLHNVTHASSLLDSMHLSVILAASQHQSTSMTGGAKPLPHFAANLDTSYAARCARLSLLQTVRAVWCV